MELVSWNDKVSINVQAIDAQHKNLIALVNDLHEAMKSQQGTEAIGALLRRLITYSREHFSTEEKYMVDYGYPEYAHHKQEHDDLLAQILGLEQQFCQGDTLLSFAIWLDLKGWALSHIVASDRQLGAFLNRKQVF
jgi:hemerythrin